MRRPSRPSARWSTAPDAHGARTHYSDWVAPADGLALQFHTNSVAVSEGPISLDRMERHPHSAQVFVPMAVSRYLVTVMPAALDGAPDPAGILCMVLPGTVGVIYRKNVWHSGVTVLDTDGSFAVLMLRGAPDDDVFAPVGPLSLMAPPLTERAPRP